MAKMMTTGAGGGQPDTAGGMQLTLAEVLATRISHDIAGALGTLAGSLELARDDAVMHDEALQLAHETANGLKNRLRLFRMAWGGGEATSGEELSEIVTNIPTPRRIHISLDGIKDSTAFNASQTQVLLNVLMLGVEALAGEGTVRAVRQGDCMRITLEGPNASWPAGFEAFLSSKDVAMRAAISQGPRPLLGPLTALIAHQTGIRLALSEGPRDQGAPVMVMPLH